MRRRVAGTGRPLSSSLGGAGAQAAIMSVGSFDLLEFFLFIYFILFYQEHDARTLDLNQRSGSYARRLLAGYVIRLV